MDKINIFGKSIVLDYLENQPSVVLSIAVTEDFNSDFLEKLKNLTKFNKIPLHKIEKKSIEKLAGNQTHGQIMATLSPVKFTDLDIWLKENTNTDQETAIAVLAGLNDQINFGGVIRSATASGLSAIILPDSGQASVTGTTYQQSAGTIGKIPIIKITNLAQTIAKLKKQNFWIYGLDMLSTKPYFDQDYKGQKIAFLLGRESSGLSDNEKKLCDELVYIPMKNKVESLNASVSAGIIFFDWQRKII